MSLEVTLVRNEKALSGISPGSKQKPASYDVFFGTRRLGSVTKWAQPSYRMAGRLICGTRGYPVEWRAELDNSAILFGAERRWMYDFFKAGRATRASAIKQLTEWWANALAGVVRREVPFRSIVVDFQKSMRHPSAWDSKALQELADDIKEHGLLSPLVVTREPGRSNKYALEAGFRRHKALQMLGVTHVAVDVVSPERAKAMVLISLSSGV